MSKTRRFQKFAVETSRVRRRNTSDVIELSQIAAKSLDALAGFLEIGSLGGVGNPERRAQPECGTLHHRDAFVLQKLGDEILVIGNQLAGRRGLADGAGAGRIDVERALRPGAIDAAR